MTAFPDVNIKSITSLIKRGMTLEAQEKLVELREAAITLEQENLALRERLAAVEAQLDVKERLDWQPPCYWLKDGKKLDGPYCQHCYDTESKLIRLQSHAIGSWFCLACKNRVFDAEYEPPNRDERRSYQCEL